VPRGSGWILPQAAQKWPSAILPQLQHFVPGAVALLVCVMLISILFVFVAVRRAGMMIGAA
jgi:hypothetical protein